MDKENLELYTDYLISNFGQAMETGLSALLDGDISHDKVTRFFRPTAVFRFIYALNFSECVIPCASITCSEENDTSYNDD